jgi:hypothetical protein
MIKSIKEVATGNEFVVKFAALVTSVHRKFTTPKGKNIQNHFLELQIG